MGSKLRRHFTLITVRTVGTLCALAGISAPVSQGAVMADLLGGDSISCGGLTFQNFTNFFSNASGGGDAPAADEVFVNPVNCAPGGKPELVFQSANWNVNAGETVDTAFSFDVLGSVSYIQLALLAFDAQGGGQVHIEESIFDVFNNNLVNLSVDTLGGPIIDRHFLGGN